MKSHSTSLTLLIALALSTIPAAAENAGDPYDGRTAEEGQCPPWTRYVPETAKESSSPVYVVIDEDMWHWYPSVWSYGESNDVDGLQRWDGYCTNEGVDNIDTYRDSHDMILFWGLAPG